MFNLNKVGRPLAKIEGGKYNGMIVSVSDHFASNADDDEDQAAQDSQRQQVPAHTRHHQGERDTLHHGTLGIGQEHIHP